ncbi:LytR/AlgR family response regulator transcription factor [Fulvivirga sedimenti]|uniref:LytTR family DNA-binding domain-containing protein n=1 Tax=Fulvivirga sedimenti TaxID=2879465 RepID=A0A9X1HR26_9BACT|nr:LytTR family DNA-binding domain-containing protein [Fulvivirga sedimenti]MCA6074677.1 LytTR family DNA-binding domain-containing protein [Fulvivirga sedimenti]MCA6075854.1 LytTR family DNA-binding domain-containing protein [Fulvivirga sedimenti]MCA6076982.1 LytTR family DNA-binding domain-containing protein [Fulvivirga sedimenti]
MTKLRCIALDDEPLALALIKEFILKTPFLELVGTCENAIEALEIVRNEKIDLIFSDIQMNDLSGLEFGRVISGMEGTGRPLLIFTTAYDQYALQGYKVDAIDYLLKPFSYEDFVKAATKALNLRNARASASQPASNFIMFKVEYQHVKVFHDDILYIEGLKDYVKVHIKNQTKPLLSLMSLKSLEERLPDNKFMRVHRSFIINLDEVNTLGRNTLTISSHEIPVSDSYRDKLQQYFNSEL